MEPNFITTYNFPVKDNVFCAPIDLLPGNPKFLKFTMAVMFLWIEIVREV